MARNCSENEKIIKLFGFDITTATTTTTTPTTSSAATVISEKDFLGKKMIKKGNRWTEDEQKAFFKGLDFHGKGNWTNIAKDFVPSRTPTQVASHAQKYFVRLSDANSNSNERKKKRKKSSVFDLHIEKTEKKTEDTDQAMVPLGNNQKTHNVPNYMMKNVPTVMPLTWVYIYPYSDHYASTSISTTTFDKPISGISSSSSSSSSEDDILELKL